MGRRCVWALEGVRRVCMGASTEAADDEVRVAAAAVDCVTEMEASRALGKEWASLPSSDCD